MLAHKYWTAVHRGHYNGCVAQCCYRSVGQQGLSEMQGLVGALTNPVIANGVAGLATSATAQATVQVPSHLPSLKILNSNRALYLG